MDVWCVGIVMIMIEWIGWLVCGYVGNKFDGGRINIDKVWRERE